MRRRNPTPLHHFSAGCLGQLDPVRELSTLAGITANASKPATARIARQQSDRRATGCDFAARISHSQALAERIAVWSYPATTEAPRLIRAPQEAIGVCTSDDGFIAVN